MANIQIGLPTLSDSIKTYVSNDYSSGTSLGVQSSVGFQNGNYIVIGEPELENTEVTNLTSSPPDNISLNISALKFSHPKGTPVYYTNWDKYSLEYRTTDTNPFIVYPSMPQDLQFDSLYTEYRDAASTNSYSWRYRYYSSEKSAYSDYSDIITPSGWGRTTVGYMVREIRKIVNDPEAKTVSDLEIIRFLNAAQDKVFTLYDRWWFLFKTGTVIPTVTGQIAYPLPSDFGRMFKVQFEYVQGASDVTYSLENKSMSEFDYEIRDNNSSNDDNMRDYAIYPADSNSPTGYLKVWPKPATAGLKITPTYFKIIPDLSTYADSTVIPIPDLLENYAISKILSIRKEDDKASEYDSMFKEQIELLKLMQRKNARPMRSLWTYRGRDPEKRLYGNRNVSGDIAKELYW